MKFSNVRLLVKDFAKCFKFYSEQLGLEPAWGDENSGYAYFKVADGIEGFALFVSGLSCRRRPQLQLHTLCITFF